MSATNDDSVVDDAVEHYLEQLFSTRADEHPIARWKRRNWTWRRACLVAEQRHRARTAWVIEHGNEPAAWPADHPPAVVWVDHLAWAVCLRCGFLGPPRYHAGEAADDARAHSGDHPLRVWSECNDPLSEGDVLFVVHPDPEHDEVDACWGVCRACGTGSVVPDTDLEKPDSHNDPRMARWAATHVCSESPDYFWLAEYGDINAYYGLDLDAL